MRGDWEWEDVPYQLAILDVVQQPTKKSDLRIRLEASRKVEVGEADEVETKLDGP